MNDYGIKISKQGTDVKTADQDDLVLSSEFPFLLADIVADVTLEVPVGPGTDVVEISHNYGYVPVFVFATGRFTQHGFLGTTVKATSSVVRCHLKFDLTGSAEHTVKVYIYRNRMV